MLFGKEKCLAAPSFLYLTNVSILWLLINFAVRNIFQSKALKIFKAGTRLVKPSLVGILEVNTIEGQEVK